MRWPEARVAWKTRGQKHSFPWRKISPRRCGLPRIESWELDRLANVCVARALLPERVCKAHPAKSGCAPRRVLVIPNLRKGKWHETVAMQCGVVDHPGDARRR